ncbi:MAG: HAMP domain-containing histidine kinase [Vicinamibacteraceae bacterium]|nr:HAMP domain-containing histidine kinase [Vicinamibacteraceae bacterium]
MNGPDQDLDDASLGDELAGRLAWFVRLRWVAVATLALAAVAGPPVGLDRFWPGLLYIAAAVAGYNALCWWRLTRARAAGTTSDPAHPIPSIDLRVLAVAQVTLDLAALLVVVHHTGYLASPLLPFFGFHMAIGTILLSTRTMYLVAGATSAAAVVLQIAGWGDAVLNPALMVPSPTSVVVALPLAAFVGFLFGIVYLTGSVSDRLKQRNTELRRLTGALRRQSDDLERLVAELDEIERRKSHYMRVSAHQLRSPLGTVRTALDVLAGGYVDLATPRGQHLIRGATERVDGLLRIVNGLLDLAKVREGRQRAPWTRQVNINQLVADLVDALAPFAEERGVRLEARLDRLAVLDWGVPPDLVHAVENLLHNAIKYSHAGGAVAIELAVEDDVALVSVTDKGIGVPEEFHDQLFLEFVRAPNARVHAPIGTGLGLALVREVAEEHGGVVEYFHPPDGGACFRLALPLHIRPREAVGPLPGRDAAGYRPDTKPRQAGAPGGGIREIQPVSRVLRP